VLGQEHKAVGDVIGMMRSFQQHVRGSDQPLGQRRGQGVGTPEVLPRAPAVTGSVHHEFEKVTFPEFLVPRMAQPPRHGWRIW
jgi:hypothetical protein